MHETKNSCVYCTTHSLSNWTAWETRDADTNLQVLHVLNEMSTWIHSIFLFNNNEEVVNKKHSAPTFFIKPLFSNILIDKIVFGHLNQNMRNNLSNTKTTNCCHNM